VYFQLSTGLDKLRNLCELCDQALLGTDQDARVALRTLPRGIRVLHTRAQRALTALEAEEQG
jgi:hypothetical protein